MNIDFVVQFASLLFVLLEVHLLRLAIQSSLAGSVLRYMIVKA